MSLVTFDETTGRRLQDELDGGILRISFTTGCGGSGYRLASASSPSEGDTSFEYDGVTIALDSMAATNLEGAILRWSEEEDGFTIDHPNASIATWCG